MSNSHFPPFQLPLVRRAGLTVCLFSSLWSGLLHGLPYAASLLPAPIWTSLPFCEQGQYFYCHTRKFSGTHWEPNQVHSPASFRKQYLFAWWNICFTIVLWIYLAKKLTQRNPLCMHAKLLQSCLTLCYPMDCGPSGSSVQGILQGRILEWVGISFSNPPVCGFNLNLW